MIKGSSTYHKHPNSMEDEKPNCKEAIEIRRCFKTNVMFNIIMSFCLNPTAKTWN